MRIFRTLAPLTAACAALGACAHYDAKPVAPERFADGYDARRLNPPPGGVWDDAALLSAAVVHSPSLRAAEASYRAARAAAKASRTPPQISLTLVA
jgi:outer membrane protein TolC